MEVSFKFNNGETGKEMVSAILALFGASTATVAASNTPAPILNPADNPAVGGEDAGPAYTGTYDSEGSPWNEQIHSDKKTLTDKGVWRKRKGAPPNLVAQVQEQMRAAGKYATPGGVVTLPAGAGATATVITPPSNLPLPGATTPTMPTLPPQESAYSKFATFVASHLNTPANPQGRLTLDWVNKALASMGHAGPDGNGYMSLLEKASDDTVKVAHNAFAQALGVPA